MMQDIERIHYYRDDQISQIMFFRAIQQRFRLADVRCGIVNVDGPKLVILDKQRKFYLICKHESTDILQQIQNLMEQISISIYMEIPLRKTESSIDEEEFVSDESEQDLLEFLKKQETGKE